MARSILVAIGLIALLCPNGLLAQHHHGFHNGGTVQVSSNPYISFPVYGSQCVSGHHLGRHPTYRPTGPFHFSTYYVSQPAPPTSYTSPATIPVTVVPFPVTFPKTTAPTSTPAARLKSLDLQARGDQRMREQKWSEARAAYKSSVEAAPDRAVARLRLGICLAVIQQYEPAIREIKRALKLDQKIPTRFEKLEIIFGPDGKMIRNSLISKLGDWLKEAPNSPDRLFLFGVILHFDENARSRDIFESALKRSGNEDVNHIVPFLNDGQHELPFDEIPKLNDQPLRLPMAPQKFDLRFPTSPIRRLDEPEPNP